MHSFAPFCTLLRSFADFRLAFALFCAHLRAFACFCVRPRLQRPHLGTSDNYTRCCDSQSKIEKCKCKFNSWLIDSKIIERCVGQFRSAATLILKFRRVTIRGAQPSARLSEDICLSEGFSEASAGVSWRVLWVSPGVHGIFRG